jgi:hypothetical protein
MMKRILELTFLEAREYLLKAESYVNFDLPKYFDFQKLIDAASAQISDRPIDDFYLNPPDYAIKNPKAKRPFPSECENVNYVFLNNTDGKFAWRPFQLIHPALYVSLVHNITKEVNWGLITKRFKEFAANPKIKCCSIPLQSDGTQSDKATTVNQWWREVEQRSLELALEYEYVLHTDITDCYGSIYTHSVPWAIHTKRVAKDPKNRKDYSLVGNVIDKHLRDMSYGQTNGIPQGSVLMDFIAEMVLGYADSELSSKIEQARIEDYQIIRYRDDYRIFSNNPQVAELIAKLLTEVLIELGMRLNAQKTVLSNHVIRDSIKPDKMFWIAETYEAKNIQKHLLLIHSFAEKFPNSGSLNKALGEFYSRIEALKGLTEFDNAQVLVSILADIMYKNPKIYPVASAVLSKILVLLNEPTQCEEILQKIMARFEKIPNTGHIKIWLQRVTIKIDRERVYEENLCKKINDPAIQIWNSEWLNESLKTLIDTTPIINEQTISEIDAVIGRSEFKFFKETYTS